MQIYAIRMYNFLRFGEKNNSIVFDLSDDQKNKMVAGELTMDQVYDDLVKDPVGNIKRIKSVGISGLLGIVGKIDGNTEASNGAGKSTIMEAICYAHYGKIVRLSANSDSNGEAGSNIITKFDGEIPESVKESWVEEYFESNGRIYRVKRGRQLSKNRKTSTPILEFEIITKEDVLSESGHRTKDTKKSIDEVNDMPYELFVSSQMFGQNDAGIFLSGTDKVRKEMLIALLDMESSVTQCLKAIRDKRAKCQRRLDGLQETIRVFESQLVETYKKYMTDGLVKNVYSEAMSNDFILSVNQAIEDDQIEIYNADKELKQLAEKIVELSNSDVIVKVANIKAEGIKTKQEKDAKTKQKEEHISQWQKLFTESLSESNKKANEKELLAGKLSKLAQQIDETKKFIADFDKKKYEEELVRANKAKEVRPKYEAKKQELSDVLVTLAESLSEIKTKTAISQNAIAKFSCQMAKIGASGKIECLECGSLVEKTHFESKIAEEQAKVHALNGQIEALNTQKAATSGQLNEVNVRLGKISEYLAAEAMAIAAISSCDVKSQSLSSLIERVAEHSKAISGLVSEIEVADRKKSEYKDKISSVEAMFKSDIEALDTKLNELRQKMVDAQSGAEAITKQIDLINKNKKAIEDKKAKLSEKIGFAKKELEQFKSLSAQLKTKSEEMIVEVKFLGRCEKLEEVFGLDGIQTRIVKRYLPLLNVYVKEFLDILSDGYLGIKMFINDKSEVDMSISGGTAPSYKMLSGGEKMIIRLASDIGLALLKFARSAKKPEIICLDEIFGPLDASRTSAVFKMLHALQDKFNRVLIITHNSEIKDMIPNNIMVEKTGGMYGYSEIKYIS